MREFLKGVLAGLVLLWLSYQIWRRELIVFKLEERMKGADWFIAAFILYLVWQGTEDTVAILWPWLMGSIRFIQNAL